MRSPLAPTGCPIAMAPPFTFNFAYSISPAASDNPSRSLQNFSDANAFVHAMTCAANASLISQKSISATDNLLFLSNAADENAGPNPITSGANADHWVSTIFASTGNLYFATASSLANNSNAAPSVTCELFPAVTIP